MTCLLRMASIASIKANGYPHDLDTKPTEKKDSHSQLKPIPNQDAVLIHTES